MAHSHDHLREMHPGRRRAHEMSKHFKRGGKVHGDEVSFAVMDASAPREFSGRIQGNTMYGTVRAAGLPETRWSASRP